MNGPRNGFEQISSAIVSATAYEPPTQPGFALSNSDARRFCSAHRFTDLARRLQMRTDAYDAPIRMSRPNPGEVQCSGKPNTPAARRNSRYVDGSKDQACREVQMSLRFRVGVVVLWLASLVVAGAWAQTPSVPAPSSQPPTIISGNDLGFRVDSHKGTTPVGTLVVRVDGQWVPVDFSMGIKRLTTK